MARKQLQAHFFVHPSGTIIPRADYLSIKKRRSIYERDSGKCQLCQIKVRFGGTTVSPFDRRPLSGHIDHIFPLSRGGQNNDGNLRLLCITCNTSRGADV
jgi:5-methylcytosine-specific restriction endonuclease McrA